MTRHDHLDTNLLAKETLKSIVPELSEAERKEYFNLHYWRYAETLKECLPWSGGRVLDVGVYPGHVAMALRRLNYEVFGVTQPGRDLNDRWAKEQITVRSGLIDKEPLPFPENYFDLVVFTEVLEHLLYDPKPLVQEFHRVLRPSGGLIVSTPNVLRLENRIKVLLGRNIYPRHEQFYSSDLYRRHNREYAMQEVISLFQPLFLVKKARYIMMTEFAVPVSDKGHVYDKKEYAEIAGDPQRSTAPLTPISAARLVLRWCKFIYPPFRSCLLLSFVARSSTH